jgi:hypothetical protein
MHINSSKKTILEGNLGPDCRTILNRTHILEESHVKM